MIPSFSPLPGPAPLPSTRDLLEIITLLVNYHARWYKAELRAYPRRRQYTPGIVEKQVMSCSPDKLASGILLTISANQAGAYYKTVSWLWRFNTRMADAAISGTPMDLKPTRKSGPSGSIGGARGYSIDRLSRLKVLASTSVVVSRLGALQNQQARERLAAEIRGELQGQIELLSKTDDLSPEELVPTTFGLSSLLLSEEVRRAISNVFDHGSKLIVSITSSKHGWSMIGRQRTALKEFTELFYYAGNYNRTELGELATKADDWGKPRKAILTFNSLAEAEGKQLNYRVAGAYNTLISHWAKAITEGKEQSRREELARRRTSELAFAAQTSQGVQEWLIAVATKAWKDLGTRNYFKPAMDSRKMGFTFEVARSEEGAWCYRAWSINTRNNLEIVLGEGWLYWEVGTTGYLDNAGSYQVTHFRTPEDAARLAFQERYSKAKDSSYDRAMKMFQPEPQKTVKGQAQDEVYVLTPGASREDLDKLFSN